MVYHWRFISIKLVTLLSTLILAPLLLLQGKRVRRVTIKLPEPLGPRNGSCGHGAPLQLLIVGDSSAAGVGVEHQDQALSGQLCQRLAVMHQVHWQLWAKTGATTRSTVQTLEQVPAVKGDIVVVALGVNDVTSGCSSKQFKVNTAQLIALLKNKFEAKRIIFSGLPPMHQFPALPQPLRWYLGKRASRLNQVLIQLCNESESEYLLFTQDKVEDVMAIDGFHPGATVYANWAEQLATKITKVN